MLMLLLLLADGVGMNDLYTPRANVLFTRMRMVGKQMALHECRVFWLSQRYQNSSSDPSFPRPT